MKAYRVGGFVRDQLLGQTRRNLGELEAALETDRDWVVVGATPEEMTALGYQAVGKDFPVFLHPETHEEHALARTERKTAPGYKGFVTHSAPDVTLEQDLARRDLTVNAMALDDDGALIDPYQGKRDLDAGILRHVSPAFIEDPVRILRVARFAARFPTFTVATETAHLMREMVRNGEADSLVPERVVQEISRGLMESKPSRMLNVLVSCGLIDRLFAELEDLGPTSAALDQAAQQQLILPARFAILAGACRSSRAVSDFLGKLRVQHDAAQLARLLVDLREPLKNAETSAAIVEVLERSDAFRRPERFEWLLQAFEAVSGSSAERFRRALRVASEVDAGALASLHRNDPGQIQRAVRQARVIAVGRESSGAAASDQARDQHQDE
ncbi:MAG: multifunctional CCA tRNA nucleotidyl transferase/2'3'-cyclic phosphodiesterase/2'nucleotidase/phosphatase [Burkholderiaceae bacterium]|nr:multifunctional CCA tRNA nucleotidyl transferase/2'3'-cyclic phosphodiesterase/2'nucleotidase/phosphatase [Burkholderiaceae bacterium]